MSEWISVDDKEPSTDDDLYVMAYDGDFHVAVFRPSQSMGFYRYDCDTYDVTPTHWMPLPEPPKDKL